MKECPKCGTMFVSGWCRSCGEGKPSGKPDKVFRDYGAEARASYQAGWPNSSVLTEQQWYNVCRFFPTVAARCRRALPDIGPHNPLHATSRMGMLGGLARWHPPARDLEAEAERAAIQGEA